MEILVKVGKMMKCKALQYCLGVILLLVNHLCFAQTIVVNPHTVIFEGTTFKNVTLDMSNGSFFITNQAALTLENCTIIGTLSPTHPLLFNVDSGKLNIKNSQMNVTALNIIQHSTTQSLAHAIQVGLGTVDLENNHFAIDQPFSAGLLITTSSIPTTGFKILNNTFERFHGVLYLISSDNAVVQNNKFVTNSYGHVVNIGNNNKILNNTIYFSGNDRLGNSIDVIDSDNVTISGNILLTPTCHGIYILNSHNLVINENRVHGGITYAMNVLSFPEIPATEVVLKHVLAQYKLKNSISSTVSITNNFMAQNRYGIAASDVDGLIIKNNYFIQRFTTPEARKFWTDNKILLTQVTNLTWTDNLYKEAYTQDPQGDNSQSSKFVPFPITGGVVL